MSDIWDADQQRYDLEHFFRFGKQRLLMDAYQTPETDREENWWTLVQLAYLQLWFARDQANNLPRPWERYLPRFRSNSPASEEKNTVPSDMGPENEAASPSETPPEEETVSSVPSPSAVQRDVSRILRETGTPARASKRRGKAPGRSAGENVVLRVRVPVIKKSVPKHTCQKQQRAP